MSTILVIHTTDNTGHDPQESHPANWCNMPNHVPLNHLYHLRLINKPPYMYHISAWARQHIALSRFLIALMHIYLVLSVIWIAEQHFHLPLGILVTLTGTGFIIVLITGLLRKKIQDKAVRFWLQKLRFFITGISCVLLLILFCSSPATMRYQLYGSLNSTFTKVTEKKERPTPENYTDRQTFYKDLKTYYHTLSKKELRKELRYELKSLRKQSYSVMDSLWIALIIIGMLVALMLVAALACSFSCNGDDVLGTVVLLLGAAGIITLTVFLIRLVTRPKKQPAEKQPALTPPSKE